MRKLRWTMCLPLLAAGCGGQAPPPRAPVAAATEATQPAPSVAEQPSSPLPAPPPGTSTPSSVVAQSATLLIKEGLAGPESALYDIESDVYLVSNLNGTPSELDDNGFISRISPEGQVLDLKFIDGAKPEIKLNAPKGMAISAGVLFVADLDRIRKFDVKSGAPLGELAVPGATFLNDVAAGPDGTIYFTDSGIRLAAKGVERTGSDAIYKIVKGHAQVVARGRSLSQPNGLLVDEAGVWVVTSAGKELYNARSGSKANVQQLPSGGLDGIIKTNTGKLYVSSWEANQVLVGAPGEDFSTAFETKSAADIGFDVKRNRLLIPMLTENSLLVQPL